MDRKGQLGDQILIFAFIFMMVIIGGGIVIGTYFYIGAEFDFRATEAKLLGYSIKDCILSDSGWLGDLKTNPDLFYENCRLNKKLITENNAIRICTATDVQGCINQQIGQDVFAVGNYALCDPGGSNKLVGCSVSSFTKDNVDYVVIATSKQSIRRSAR